jgi:sporadic carbohydrate cluster protein (TIGR04323 family)
MENLSHKVQREINFGYCLTNNLEFSLEETEIHGVDHYPNLYFYLQKKIYKHIVMTSLLCLPTNLKLRNKLISTSKKNKIELHFSLENKKLSDFQKEEINKYYEKIVKNKKLLV